MLTELPETGDGRNMFAVEFNVQSDAEVEHAIEAHMEADLSSFVQQSQVLESEDDERHPSSGVSARRWPPPLESQKVRRLGSIPLMFPMR